MKTANLTVRFFLELASLAALAYWGWVAAETVTVRLIQALVGPVLFAAAWGFFISPKAPRRLPDPSRWMVEVALFTLVAGALVTAGVPTLGLVFGVTAGAHLVLMVWWAQRGM